MLISIKNVKNNGLKWEPPQAQSDSCEYLIIKADDLRHVTPLQIGFQLMDPELERLQQSPGFFGNSNSGGFLLYIENSAGRIIIFSPILSGSYS